jgi:hypothetical protein
MAMEIAAGRSAQVRHDLESIFRMPIEHCVVHMQDWLNTLGVSPRDLRATVAGQHRLDEALMSARGRNFIEDSSL